MPEFKSKKEFLKNLSGCDDMSAAKRNYPKLWKKYMEPKLKKAFEQRKKRPKIS